MPCPPSYEELELMRLDREFTDVRRTLGALWTEAPRTLSLAQTLLGADREHITEPEFERGLSELASYAAHGERWPAYPVAPPPRSPDGWPSAAELAHGDAELGYLWRLARAVELSLCIVRTGVCQARLAHPEWRTGPQAEALDTLVAAHLAHRTAERTQHRKALVSTLSVTRLPDQRALLEAKLQALDALTDEELLTRRGATHT